MKTTTLVLYTLIFMSFMWFPRNSSAQNGAELFTIYLVRHAEKQSATDDPSLTACGNRRAESISSLLDAVPIEAIFSTEYKRTQATALPTATAHELDVQSYSPQDLKTFADQLLQNKQNALVVGHSNTTGVLAGLLVGEERGAFDESIYNRVYQVVISKENRQLHVLHTAFSCED